MKGMASHILNLKNQMVVLCWWWPPVQEYDGLSFLNLWPVRNKEEDGGRQCVSMGEEEEEEEEEAQQWNEWTVN